MDSILTSIKKLLGIEEEYNHFDVDIIININSAMMTLTQLGVGPPDGFSILDKETKWTDYIGERKDLNAIKMYIYYKTRLAFDPPTNAFVVDSMTKDMKELEWRISIQAGGGVVV